jgi:hypothetical protein
VALIAGGFGAFVLGLFTNIRIAGGAPVALTITGAQAMTVGTILFCYQQLLIRSTRNEEALRFQYDIGYESGWRECEQNDHPTLVDLDAYRRPSGKLVSHT